MYKILLILLSLSSAVTLRAQTLNGVPLEQLDATYIEIRVRGYSLFNNSRALEVLTGADDLNHSLKANLVRDDQQQLINFSSLLHGANFMTRYGYVIKYAGLRWNNNQLEIDYYLMQKVMPDSPDAGDRIQTIPPPLPMPQPAPAAPKQSIN